MQVSKLLGCLMLCAALVFGLSSMEGTSSFDQEASVLVGGDDCGVFDAGTCGAQCPAAVLVFKKGDGGLGVTSTQSCGDSMSCSTFKGFGRCVKPIPDPVPVGGF